MSAVVAFDRIEQIQAMMASLAPVGAQATPSSSSSPTAFASSLQAATGASGLSDRPSTRTHIWQDPAEVGDPDPALTTS